MEVPGLSESFQLFGKPGVRELDRNTFGGNVFLDSGKEQVLPTGPENINIIWRRDSVKQLW